MPFDWISAPTTRIVSAMPPRMYMSAVATAHTYPEHCWRMSMAGRPGRSSFSCRKHAAPGNS